MADIPTPRPLTAHPPDHAIVFQQNEAYYAEIERLRAEVDRLTANLATTTSQLDGACSVILRGIRKFDLDLINWTSAEGAAIQEALRRARAAQPQEDGDE